MEDQPLSRADKQRRRQHRSEKKHRIRRSSPDRWASSDRPLQLVSYDISFEPLNLPGEKIDLPEEERRALFELVHTDPVNAIERIRLVLHRHPNSPILLNWLCSAYEMTSDDVNAELTAKLNYDVNPDYLFAKLNYAAHFLRRGDIAKFDEILGNNYELKLLYPDREVFHISEVVGFYGMMVQYCLRKRQPDVAERYYNILQEIAPEHPTTQQVKKLIEGSVLLQLARRLSRSLLRTGELP
jgi:hypothetical protein